jgi:outer membrane autotransporter protein
VLRGTGTITGPTSVFGTLAPGNSPGTLTFNASVTMQSSGTLALDIDGTGTGSGAGNYSRVIVNGGSFTAAGTLAPRLRGITYSNFETPGTDSYTPPLGQRFAGVVQASGGVLGGFSSLTQPAGLAAGTRFDALYGTNAIDLIVTPAQFGNLGAAGLAQSASQSALGAALDVVRPAAGTVMTSAQSSVFGTLYGLAPGAITVALDQLSPLIYADAMMTARNGWGLMAGAIGGQMASRRGLAADSDVNTAPGPNGSTIWISALGQYSATRAGGGSPGYSAGIGGTAAGIDMPVDPDTMLGVAIGASGGKVWGQSGGQATVSTGQLQIYGQWRHEAWFVEAQLGGLYQQSSVRRDMSIFGVTARGTVDGFAGGGGVRAGMQHRVDGWLIEPSVSFGGFAFTQNGITESGAGAMSAAIARQTLGSAQSTLGISAQRGFALTDDVYVVAKGRLGWAHEFAANRGIVRASLSGLAGSGFTQSSAPIGRDAALIGLSADAKVKDWPVSFFVGYGGAFSGSSNAQTITAGVRFVW